MPSIQLNIKQKLHLNFYLTQFDFSFLILLMTSKHQKLQVLIISERRTIVDLTYFLVAQKISAISSILEINLSATATSTVPFVPAAPASLVASLKRAWSCGCASK